jgi:hypothetical protein
MNFHGMNYTYPSPWRVVENICTDLTAIYVIDADNSAVLMSRGSHRELESERVRQLYERIVTAVNQMEAKP